MQNDAETEDKIEGYRQQVLKWNQRLPLVSRKSPKESLDRLINHSLRAGEVIPENIRTIVDIGSGAGLPGIPLAIVRPDVHVWLVERSGNKVVFLKNVVRRLQISNADVVGERFTAKLLERARPLAVISIGVGSYSRLAAELWPHFSEGDGLLLFINESLTREIAADVSCETFCWQPLGGSRGTGIAWLQK